VVDGVAPLDGASSAGSGDPGWISSGRGAVRMAAMATGPMKDAGSTQADAELTESDIPRLRKEWIQICDDIFANQPDELPPLREINHRIPLIDDSKVYHHRQPKCPDAFKPALMAKIERYTRAGWWIPITASRAMPMLCIPKSAKNPNELRTVFDLQEQNANTHKDLTPMPDQDAIRHAVAKARYRSKCDISNAYELIRVEPEDVWKTAFATIAGTFASNVMQQGDCNAPSTFQRFVTYLFRDSMGNFVYAYLDDIFIFRILLGNIKLTFSRSSTDFAKQGWSLIRRNVISSWRGWTAWDTSSTIRGFTRIPQR
jgi:hypothetical protein